VLGRQNLLRATFRNFCRNCRFVIGKCVITNKGISPQLARPANGRPSFTFIRGPDGARYAPGPRLASISHQFLRPGGDN
jgi:hypothetical protein